MKSREKLQQVREIWSQHKQVPKTDETRCSKGEAFLAGMPNSLQLRNPLHIMPFTYAILFKVLPFVPVVVSSELHFRWHKNKLLDA